MRRGPEVSGWVGSLFPEPIAPIVQDENYCILRGDVCVVHNGCKNGFVPCTLKDVTEQLKKNGSDSLDFSKEWYYCASGNAIRNCLPCDECTRKEPVDDKFCIRFFKLHPCAYFNSAHCNGSTCEYWSPYGDNPHCTYGPYLAWLAAPPAPAIEPAKKPAKAKKQPIEPKHDDNYCVLRGGECAVHNGCQNGDVPCTLKDVPHLEEIHLPCEIHALLDLAIKPAKEPMAVLLDGKWYSEGKEISEVEANAPVPQSCSGCLCQTCINMAMCNHCQATAICAKYNARTVACPAFSKAEGEGWTCSDCLCPKCANNKENCHDCKGPVYCSKHGGKIGNCPDFRTEEGKEQHCLENGCLCFKCQLIGEQCEDCPGPIRCDGPRMKCKEYVGTEVTT